MPAEVSPATEEVPVKAEAPPAETVEESPKEEESAPVVEQGMWWTILSF